MTTKTTTVRIRMETFRMPRLRPDMPARPGEAATRASRPAASSIVLTIGLPLASAVSIVAVSSCGHGLPEGNLREWYDGYANDDEDRSSFGIA